MTVAIVVPAYNAEKYLGRTIESVLTQTYRDWRLVIVDDGSRDGTAQVAQWYCERDARMRLVQQVNGGVAAARNRGFAESDPDAQYVTFLDADDLWEPDMLQILTQQLDENDTLIAAYGTSCYIDGNDNLIRPGEHEDWSRHRYGIDHGRLREWPADAPTTFEVLAYYNCIPVSGIVMRMEAKRVAGDFDPACVPNEDWDMWLRLSLQGKIGFMDRVVYRYRRHEANASASEERMQRAEVAVRTKMLDFSGLNPEQRRIASVAWRCWQRHVGDLRFNWCRKDLAHGKPIDAIKQFRHAVALYMRSMQPAPSYHAMNRHGHSEAA